MTYIFLRSTDHLIVDNFISIMDKVTGKIMSKAKMRYNIIGDVDIIWNSRGDNSRKLNNSFCGRNNLTNLNKVNTHYTADGQHNSCLDHFLTNSSDLYTQHGVCPYMETDYLIIFGAQKKFKVSRNKVFIGVRSYKNYDKMSFLKQSLIQAGPEVHCEVDFDRAWDLFREIFNGIMSKYLHFQSMKDPAASADNHFFSSCNENVAKPKRLRNWVTALSRDRKRALEQHLELQGLIVKSCGWLLGDLLVKRLKRIQ